MTISKNTLAAHSPVNTGADPLPPEAKVWPTGEVELPRFFVLDEHEFPDDKTGEPVRLDKKRLEHIAARCNSRRKRTGDLVPLVIGHTKDHKPETDQPPIVGYAVDFRVEPFFDTGKYAIACTPVARSPEHVQYFREYPRRSVELWLNPDDLDPISLLGATTPRRDLGVHRFEKIKTEVGSFRFSKLFPNHVYSITEPNPLTPNSTVFATDPADAAPMGDSDLPPLDPRITSVISQVVGEQLATNPLFKQLDALLPVLTAMTAQGEESMPGEGEDDLLGPNTDDEEGADGEADDGGQDENEDEDGGGEEEMPEEEMEASRGEEPDEGEGDEDTPNKKNAAHCGPNNGYRANYSRKEIANMTDDELTVAYHARKFGRPYTPPSVAKSRKLQRQPTPSVPTKPITKVTENAVKANIAKKEIDRERTERVKLQKANEALAQRVAELEERNRVNEITEELRPLDEAGVHYDTDKEIKRLVKMSKKEEREEHINYLLEIGTKSKRDLPNGGKLPVTPDAQAKVKFERNGQAKTDETTGPKSFEEAQAVANATYRKPTLTPQSDVMKAMGVTVTR